MDNENGNSEDPFGGTGLDENSGTDGSDLTDEGTPADDETSADDDGTGNDAGNPADANDIENNAAASGQTGTDNTDAAADKENTQ